MAHLLAMSGLQLHAMRVTIAAMHSSSIPGRHYQRGPLPSPAS